MTTGSRRSDASRMGDRSPREFKSHKAERDGEIMLLAQKNVLSTHPLNSIKNVARLMKEHDFRRIPVTDAGTNRLEGMAVAIDILDFLGGGKKYNIILKDYNGNFLSAINCPISKIMNPDPPYVERKARVDDVIKIMMEKRTSSIPVVDDASGKRVIAIVTERDVLPTTENFGVPVKEVMNEKCITATPGMMISDVSKIMVRNRLRRLPVIAEDELIGIVTVFDVLKFLGYGEFRGMTKAEEVLSKTRVEDIMAKKVVTMTPEDDISAVTNAVKDMGIGGFPVVDDGEIVGIVTTSDVISYVYKD